MRTLVLALALCVAFVPMEAKTKPLHAKKMKVKRNPKAKVRKAPKHPKQQHPAN